MSRVIVSIISEQTIPNYLFIKEIFQPEDSLLFIASQKFSERIGWIVQSLGFTDISVESILFPEGGEERWEDMESMLKEKLSSEQLDVVFVSGNKLFVRECKTGISSQGMFNETVYKATAIKEAVLGLSATTFICSLAPEDENLKNTAKNMGISYKCREDVESPSRMEDFMNQIKGKAKD